ncbi:hypothetical protein M0812_15155 [Anaeramoeba flamelloides]|uniref:Sec23/Sec24 trunk domain-containing protein n=1 Tax=Anaeramoeba flamelloides TaxID=1746091 RepID=A0AAV7ZAS8_9EUKA|nr:hypothetical protein M0812_15155 [Anaeramoeba flamelloides]
MSQADQSDNNNCTNNVNNCNTNNNNLNLNSNFMTTNNTLNTNNNFSSFNNNNFNTNNNNWNNNNWSNNMRNNYNWNNNLRNNNMRNNNLNNTNFTNYQYSSYNTTNHRNNFSIHKFPIGFKFVEFGVMDPEHYIPDLTSNTLYCGMGQRNRKYNSNTTTLTNSTTRQVNNEETEKKQEETMIKSEIIQNSQKKKKKLILICLKEESDEDEVLGEEDIPQGAGVWCCEFCDHLNILKDWNKMVKPNEEQTDFLLEEASEKNEKNKDGRTIIFCLDTSGSMSITTKIEGNKIDLSKLRKKTTQNQTTNSIIFDGGFGGGSGGGFGEDLGNLGGGFWRQRQQEQQQQQETWVSRLECLQIAVGNQIEELTRESPESKVILVTFNNEVTIHGNNVDNTRIISGGDFMDLDKLKNIGSNYSCTQNVKASGESVIKKLHGLTENGQTALGAAAVIATSIASQKQGSKVFLCTDGLSNIGIRALEKDEKNQNSEEQVTDFYDQLADYCSEKGVILDLITLENTDCNINEIGKLPNRSGGEIDIVKPEDLSTRFKNIMAKPVIATNSVLEMILHKSLYLYDEDDRKIGARMEKEVGNITEGIELSFNYGVKKDADEDLFSNKEKVPFQAQIKYTKLDGSKWLRIITQYLNTTKDVEKVIADLDYSVMNQNVIPRASKWALKGNVKKSKQILQQQRQIFNTLQPTNNSFSNTTSTSNSFSLSYQPM